MTAITNQTMLNPWAAYSAGTADFVWTAGTLTPGVAFVSTGREVVLAWNTDVADPYTITINAVDDETGRAESIAAYSLASGDFAAFGVSLTNSQGWQSVSKTITVLVNNVAVKIAVLTLPAGYPS